MTVILMAQARRRMALFSNFTCMGAMLLLDFPVSELGGPVHIQGESFCLMLGPEWRSW